MQGCCDSGDLCVPDASSADTGRGTCQADTNLVCLNDDGATWQEHVNLAGAVGGTLLTINDMDTDGWVAAAIADYTGVGTGSDPDYWFGLLDVGNNMGNDPNPGSESYWLSSSDPTVDYVRSMSVFDSDNVICVEWESMNQVWGDASCDGNQNSGLYQYSGVSVADACSVGTTTRCFARSIVETGTYNFLDNLCVNVCLSDDQATWQEHVDTVEAAGGTLLTINDASTDAWVEAAISDYTGNMGDYWFGLVDQGVNDMMTELGPDSFWLEDMSIPVDYVRPGSVFNQDSVTCVEWETSMDRWEDEGCNNMERALYQFSSVPIADACGVGTTGMETRCFPRAIVETGMYDLGDNLCTIPV